MDVLFVLCGFLPTTWLAYWTPTTLLLSADLAYHWTSTAHLTPTNPRLLIIELSFVGLYPRMTTRKCCVRSCNQTYANILLHKFPNPVRDSAKFKSWIESLDADMLFIDEMTVFKQYRICHSHFETKYHSCSGRLTRNAVPTLFLSEVPILPAECKDTADVLIFFDNLFDSLNGSYENYKKRSGKPLLSPVTPKSSHKNFWREAKNILKSMKFIDDNNNKSAFVPTLKNWHQTVENIEYIVDILSNKYSLTSLWMRHFNQDPLENFFGSVRSHGYRNNNPTCAGFEAAFASLLINNLSSVHSPGSNCEADTCSATTFNTLKKLFFNKTVASSCTIELNYEDIDGDHIFIDVDTKRANAKIRAQLEYVTGYVLKKIRSINCDTCKRNLFDASDDNIIYIREYFENKRLLTYPSYSMIKCFSNLQDVVSMILRNDPKKHNIKQYIKTVFSVVIDYDFLRCKEHKKEIIEKIEEISVNLFLYNWCKDTNKILSGCRTDFDIHSLVQTLAYNYCKKRLKK